MFSFYYLKNVVTRCVDKNHVICKIGQAQSVVRIRVFDKA